MEEEEEEEEEEEDNDLPHKPLLHSADHWVAESAMNFDTIERVKGNTNSGNKRLHISKLAFHGMFETPRVA